MTRRSEGYLCQAVSRACDVLEALDDTSTPLRLVDVAARTGLSVSTAFRILHTLQRRGLVVRVGERQYRSNLRGLGARRRRVGYGSQSQTFPFARAVEDGLRAAASDGGIELVVLDNHYSARTAIRNAERFVRERVELVVEFQTDELAAPIVASKLHEAGIPLIAVEIPHPGATYYGADNYRAGLIGGRLLGQWARREWRGSVDEVLLLELPMAGALPRSRLLGTIDGIRAVLPSVDESRVSWLDGKGQFGASLEAVRRHLRRTHNKRVLISAINDPSALGALRAFEEAGRGQACVVAGQNASLEGRSELRKPASRFIGSVAYFPERYGPAVIGLCLDILEGRPVPPAMFVKHELITRDNVDRLYANDAVLAPGEVDSLLARQIR